MPAGLAITKDDAVCGTRPSLSRLVVGRGRGVENAVVYLKGIDEGKNFRNRKTATLDQKGCEFRPHIMVLNQNAPLEIVNNDRVLHNVHAYEFTKSPTTLFNIAQPIKGQKSRIDASQFRNAGLVMITCDAGHPWMSAYIFRVENPYYAVTDANGHFRIDGVPPGTYTLAMWHEGVGIKRKDLEQGTVTKYTFEEPYSQSQQISVPPRGSVRAEFELKLR